MVEISEKPCPRCAGQLLLSLRLPHPGFAPDLAGIFLRIVTLCPVCDLDTAHAAGLLAFFALHAEVDLDNAGEFVLLLHQWLDRIPPPPRLDPQVVEAEWQAWRRGDYD